MILPRMGIRLEGIVTLELISARTRLVKRTWRMKNLIVTAGLNAIGLGNSIEDLVAYAAAGTSGDAPASGQAGLIAEVGPAVDNRTNDDDGTPAVSAFGGTHTSRIWTRLFSEDQVVGTLREIGFFKNVSGAPMWSRVLVTDFLGNADFVDKTNEDLLRVTYEVRLFPPDDTEVTIDVGGVSTVIAGRPCNFADNDAWGADGVFFESFGLDFSRPHLAFEENTLVAIGADPNGASVAASSVITMAYTGGNFRDVRARWNPNVANFALGIGRLAFIYHAGTTLPMFQFTFTPRLSKTALNSLIATARVAWGT